MIRYSVLIPQRDAGAEIANQLPELRRVLDLLTLPYEVICIDQASAVATRGTLEGLLTEYPFLRVLTLAEAASLEVALAAGVAAARGAIVVAIGPGREYPVSQIPHLIAELAHADIVFGRAKTIGWSHLWQKLVALPQQWLLGPEARASNGLLWAARRDAVADLEATRGSARFLPWLLAKRGLRVGETTVRFETGHTPSSTGWPHPGDLLAVWWLGRRWQRAKVDELRVKVPAADGDAATQASRWIDSAQDVVRREADVRKRDSA
jgi:hypothetical protein